MFPPLLLLAACAPPAVDSAPVELDLVSPVPEGAVRAGVVTDPAALFGGIAAEGRPGDVKIDNHLVRFVVQQPGDSSYYLEYGGGIVDADVVRPDGVPGRDLIDEVGVMIGLGRAVEATAIEVVSDGSDGLARVRVTGHAAPMRLVTGALENPDLVPSLDLDVVTEYALAPDEWALRVTTTVTSHEAVDVSFAIGDIGIVGMEVAEPYVPGRGRDGADLGALEWSAVVADHNEVAVALLGEDEPLQQGTIGQILGSIAPVIAGFGPTVTVAAGGETSWTRRIGVAPDPATLSGAQLAWRKVERQALGGVVRDAAGVRVGGARVHILDAQGDPLALAFANADGAWSAVVPPGTVSAVASGRGRGITVDLPEGHGWYSPYGVDREGTLTSLREGAAPIPFAEGCGVGAAGPTATVTVPGCGVVHVEIADGGPAVVYLWMQDADVAVDDRLVPGRPSGVAAIGFVRDGAMDLPVEPGRYLAVVRRGVRDEVHVEPIEVVAGEPARVVARLPRAWDLPDVVQGDPHSHAAPSGDGGISMEDRLVVSAANGLDVHFGTDHDHVADYRPLLAPLGLADRLDSVVADEVSPVLRGHFNAWPAVASDAANGGAPRWWFGYADTAEIFGWMRELVGPDGVVQANHPVGDSGMFSFASYDTYSGVIGAGDHWSPDFDAMEVLNSGDYEEYLPYYLDLVRRGEGVGAVGVSDSHTHTSGNVGLDSTFFYVEGGRAAATPEALAAAVHAGRTAVSHGPLVDVRLDGDPLPGQLVVGSRVEPRVTVYAPSWMPVQEVTVWVDGEIAQTLACKGAAPRWCEVTPSLDFTSDASVVVTAESTTATMGYAFLGHLAWGLAGAFFVDVDGDGWTPAYGPLTIRP